MTSISRRANALIFAGIVLLFASLLVGYGPFPGAVRFYFWPKDLPHWFGWITALSIAILLFYSYAKKWRGKMYGNLHCVLGVISVLTVLYHVSARFNPFTGTPIGFLVIQPVHYSNFFMLTILILIVVSGLIRRWYPKSTYSRIYGAALHIPVSVAFILMLLFHVFQKTGVI